jgi:hypothetical protein
MVGEFPEEEMIAYLEAILETFVFFQKSSVIDDDLSISNLQLKNLVINILRRFHSPKRFFEIHVKRPEF